LLGFRSTQFYILTELISVFVQFESVVTSCPRKQVHGYKVAFFRDRPTLSMLTIITRITYDCNALFYINLCSKKDRSF